MRNVRRPIPPSGRQPLIRTHHLGWSDPALPRAADRLVETYTDAGVADLDGVVVAVPGARAGRRLKELLVDAADARGARLAPPEIVTVGDLPERLYTPADPVADPALRRVAWTSALRGAPADEVTRLFARRPPANDVAAWARLGREVERLHRSVARGGHDFASVEAACRAGFARGGLGWDDTARWAALGKLEAGYRRLLAGAGRVDPDLERLRAVAAGDLRAPRALWLVSIPEMPGAVRDAVRAVAELGEVHVAVHAPEAEAERFDPLGCVRPEAWAEAELPLRREQIVLCDRPADQAEAVARALADLDGSHPADRIVIGVPDASVVPWIEEGLGDAGVPVRDAAGTPVEHTAPYRLLEAVAEVLDERRFTGFAALARHPDVGRWMAASPEVPEFATSGAWVPVLDRWYETYVPARLPAPGTELPGASIDRFAAVPAFVRAVDETLLGAFTGGGSRPLGAWMRPTVALLADVYAARGLRRSLRDDRDLLRVLDQIAEAAQALERLPEGLAFETDAAGALGLLLEQLRGASVPAPADEAAIELLGWLELPLDDADVVVVTGVNEPRLPESVSGDPFLPDALRTAIGLVDNRRRYARDAYRLSAMAHTARGDDARHLLLVSGRRTAAGDQLRPSRLLFATSEGELVERVLGFYDPRGATAAAADGSVVNPVPPDATPPHGPSGFRLPPEPEITLPEDGLTSLRVTDLRALLTNPYLFALSRLRHCETVDDDGRELDPLRFGDLAHTVLERFGADPSIRASGDVAAVARWLDDALDAQAAGRFGPEAAWAHVAVRIQLEQLRARLHRFAEWHVDRLAQGWRVHAVEVGTGEGGVGLDVDGTRVGIRARIDRVDHHPETGRWVVFDYKTSEVAQTPDEVHRTSGEWVDLQLPLYRWLLPRLVSPEGMPVAPGAEEGDIDVGYILLPRDLDQVGGVIAEWDDADHAEALEAGREAIRRVRAEGFRFDPAKRLVYPEPELEALLGHGRLAGLLSDDDGDNGEDA